MGNRFASHFFTLFIYPAQNKDRGIVANGTMFVDYYCRWKSNYCHAIVLHLIGHDRLKPILFSMGVN